ncbi:MULTISPECIES: MarR family winged helix-turn-helix transcriptional regulator [Burkholderia]|uniref:Transcriptional regulator, MarR family n=1 Tax=Burkholderia singularis TaxID=1503053 RepID=A0A238GZJ6_9BURK|nr:MULTISPECIES: MarR family transcriptional regulator [Burkholderia]AOK29473.1 MarR family transcriptional regulator [Burkholderia sp. Bp7605]SMF98407.1 Transcriptional regulator, MarR family [Burkholderia singularis]
MAGGKTGLDQFVTDRMHVLNKLSDRGIGAIYQTRLGISLPEARAIASVGAFGPCSVMELARRANLDKSQASRTAETLIGRGLVKRGASDADARVVLIALTPAGAALNRKITALARKWNDGLLDCLNDSEKLAFSRALDKLIASARDRAQ